MSVTIEDPNVNSTGNLKNSSVSHKDVISGAQRKLIDAIAIQEGFTDYDIDTVMIASDGGNYLGILYDVVIRGEKLKKYEELRLFVKVAASNENMREVVPVHDVYCSEMYIYKVLSKLYTDLQVNANIRQDKMYTFTKFYGSIDTDFGETIVLENLSYQNYTVYDRFKGVTLDYAKAAVENLAKFHALSYVIERQDPEYFNEVIKQKKGNLYLDNDGPEKLKEFGPMITKRAVINLRNREYCERVRNFCDGLFTNTHKYIKTNKYPVLCHGDYRGNNLLVKYENERVTSIITIDYQLIHYGSPLNDLLYFIFGSTDSEFRRLHFDYIIEFYYKSLGSFLSLFTYDLSDIYPKEEFDMDVKGHMMMGMTVAVHLLPFMLVSEEHAPDLEKLDGVDTFAQIADSPNEIFLDRYNGIIEDFVRWGYL